jgi:hypothetical protein
VSELQHSTIFAWPPMVPPAELPRLGRLPPRIIFSDKVELRE